MLDIAEYAPDLFAVNIGNFSAETAMVMEGRGSVWSVDMGVGMSVSRLDGGMDELEARFLNGMASVPEDPSTLAFVDLGAGTVYSLDTRTGAYEVAIQDVPALKSALDAAVVIGINGTQFREGEPDMLYRTKSFKDGHFGRVAIDPLADHQAGPVEVLFRCEQSGARDDFTFDAEDNAWLTSSPRDTVLELEAREWDAQVVVDETSVVAGPTARGHCMW